MVGKIPNADLARKTGWFATQRACNTEMIPKIYININIYIKKLYITFKKESTLSCKVGNKSRLSWTCLKLF